MVQENHEGVGMSDLTGVASWTWTDDAGGLWYIKLGERAPPPYLRQVHVEAIVDLDAEGRVAGFEIVDLTALPPGVSK